MTILVTGALGFVGLGIVRALAERHAGETILAADLGTSDAAVAALIAPFENVETLTLDVTDRSGVRAVLEDRRPEAIVHAAALTLSDPDARLATFDVNLGGTVNVLDAAAGVGVRRVVAASSSGVYARGGGAVRQEDDALDLGNAYAASKHAVEAVAACYGAAAVRIGPVYGPLEREKPSRPRISAIGVMAAALAAGRPVTLHGPGVTRDWTHVDDIAAGIDALIGPEPLRHTVYNLSAGRAESLAEVAAAFAAYGLDVRWTDDPAAADVAFGAEDARVPLAIDRLAERGFKPRHTLQSGIAALVKTLQ